MKYIFFIAVLFFTVNANAQSAAQDSVKNVINTMFAAMKNADGKALQNCFADSAILQTIVVKKSGQVIIKDESIIDFAAMVATMPKDSADERISFETIKTDADLASVWTPYQFYYAGSYSHCGVNSFQLVRINGIWKIQYLIDTRRNKCD